MQSFFSAFHCLRRIRLTHCDIVDRVWPMFSYDSWVSDSLLHCWSTCFLWSCLASAVLVYRLLLMQLLVLKFTGIWAVLAIRLSVECQVLVYVFFFFVLSLQYRWYVFAVSNAREFLCCLLVSTWWFFFVTFVFLDRNPVDCNTSSLTLGDNVCWI